MPTAPPQTFADAEGLYARACAWAAGHAWHLCLDARAGAYPYGGFPRMVAAGARQVIEAAVDGQTPPPLALAPGHWWFGYVGYDYGLALQNLQPQGTRLPPAWHYRFFEPEHLLLFVDGHVHIWSDDAKEVIEKLKRDSAAAIPLPTGEGVKVGPERVYWDAAFATLQSHLYEGDIYEANLCHAVSHTAAGFDVAAAAAALHVASPMPFMYQLGMPGEAMAGSSPERFLRREGVRILSQPIKGTLPRGATPAEDEALRAHLATDEKLRAENMMIADLTRNDLARACLPGTVQVEELFGIYTFERLHQMITTVAGTLPDDVRLADILEATFPMGSMTGAPKRRTMEILEQVEGFARGPFSGAVGYVIPGGDFDFAVIIRTLFYAEEARRLWYATGGAILYGADAESEWAELQLKAAALQSVAARYL